jgi:hypothetical protein
MIRRVIGDALNHIGRRGAFLLLTSMVLGVFGIAVGTAPPDTASGQYQGLAWAAPLSWWAFTFHVGSGVCAAASVFKRAEEVAFGVAALLLLSLSGSVLAAWVLSGIPRIWLLASLYAGYAGFTLLVAGWAENPR